MTRVTRCAPIALLLTGIACSGAPEGPGAPRAPAVSLAGSGASAPTAPGGTQAAASASASAAPSSAPVASSEPVPAGPPAACRGGRLMLSGVVELCEVADGTEVLPDVVKVEIDGPKEVSSGALVDYEIRLVNRGQEPLLLAFGLTCNWSVEAPAAIRDEGVSNTVSSCRSKRRYFEVLLEPGGMVVEPVKWRARGEVYVDGNLKKREPLAPGKYELSASTWLIRGDPGEEKEKSKRSFGISLSATGKLSIVVR